ncbi:MAG: FtsB family cell division protein [Solirubrobacteraceae bacterium]
MRRLRWERLGRVGLLLVLGVVVLLYGQHIASYLSARSQADRQQATVDRLLRQNARLSAVERSLGQPATIIADARRLGMVRPGEQPYSVTPPSQP